MLAGEKKMKKKLSIIIPLYNNLSVGKSIASIDKKEEVELIIIDGGSNDETLSIVKQYKDIIDYFVSEVDCGIYDAMNKGLKVASGEWIFTLAADDQLVSDPLSIIHKYENCNCDLICGNLIAKDFEKRYFVISPDKNTDRLELECTICHPGTFFRKSAYKKYGMYDLQYKCAADHELFLRFVNSGCKIKIIPEIITYFVYGGTSTINPWRAFKEDVEISDKYGVSIIRSRKNLVLRIIKYYGAKVKNVLGLKHTTKFMNMDELLLFLKNHPEVNEKILTVEEY